MEDETIDEPLRLDRPTRSADIMKNRYGKTGIGVGILGGHAKAVGASGVMKNLYGEGGIGVGILGSHAKAVGASGVMKNLYGEGGIGVGILGSHAKAVGASGIMKSLVGAAAEAGLSAGFGASGILKSLYGEGGVGAGVLGNHRDALGASGIMKSLYGKNGAGAGILGNHREAVGASGIMKSLVGTAAEAGLSAGLGGMNEKLLRLGLGGQADASMLSQIGKLAARDALASFAAGSPPGDPALLSDGWPELDAGVARGRDAPEGLDGFQRAYVANFVFVMTLLSLLAAWLNEANRAGEDLLNTNRVELLFTLGTMLSLAGGSWALVMYPERLRARAVDVFNIVAGRDRR
jgi:hypothetical protein